MLVKISLVLLQSSNYENDGIIIYLNIFLMYGVGGTTDSIWCTNKAN